MLYFVNGEKFNIIFHNVYLKTISSSTGNDFSRFSLVYGKRILDL